MRRARVRGAGIPRAATLGLTLLLAACGGGTTTPADVSPDPVTASAVGGRFELTFTVDRTTLRPGDSITGSADLHLRVGTSGAISGPQFLVGFEFVEVGGQQRMIVPVVDASCAPHQVGSDAPVTTPLFKTSAVEGSDAAFVAEFLRGDAIRLPAGEWDITAVASFTDGRGCTGQQLDLRAPVRVKVNP